MTDAHAIARGLTKAQRVTLPKIVWHSMPPRALERRRVKAEIRDLMETGLSKPSDLIFHHVDLDDDFAHGRCVIVWGRRFSRRFHAQLYPAKAPA